MSIGCNGPPFLAILAVLYLQDCLGALQSCPLGDVCCPLCSRFTTSSRAVHLSIWYCTMQCSPLWQIMWPKYFNVFVWYDIDATIYEWRWNWEQESIEPPLFYCSEASVHTSLITRTPKCEDTLQCVVLLCFMYCAVVLIFYSHVLNKVSSYTVLVESCCDALQYLLCRPCVCL